MFVRNLHRRATRVSVLFMAVLAVAAVALLSTWPGSAESAGTRQLSYPQLVNTDVGGYGVDKNGWTRHSQNPSISADGKWVVFQSQSSNLDPLEKEENTPSQEPLLYEHDIFLHNVDTGSTDRVSKAWNGDKADGESFNPSISPNGEWIAFETEASNLSKIEPLSGVKEIIRYKVENGVPTLPTLVTSQPLSILSKDAKNPSVADDGTVAFESKSTTLVLGITDDNNGDDVFIRKKVGLGTTKLVSAANGTSDAGDRFSSNASISGNGDYVAFRSYATNLTSQLELGGLDSDIFIRGIDGGETELVSVAFGGGFGDGGSRVPSLSNNGDRVAFKSRAKNLVDPPYDVIQARIFVRDRTEGAEETKEITPGNDLNFGPSISPDGSHVAFPRVNGGGGNYDVVVHDIDASTESVESKTNAGDVAPGKNKDTALANPTSGSHRVVFESNSNELFHSYLGVGLLNWEELLAYKRISADGVIGICGGGSYCYNVYVREMMDSAPEPGLYDPEGSIEDDDPLVSVDHNPKGAGQPTDVTVTLRRPQDYHEFKDVDFKMPVGIGARLDIIDTCKKAVAESPDTNCPDSSKVGDIRADVAMLNSLRDIPWMFRVPKYGIDSRVPNCNKNGEGFIPDMDPGFDGVGEPCAGSGVFLGDPDELVGNEAARLYAVIQDTDLLTAPVVVDLVVYLVEDEHYRVKVVSKIPNTIENMHVQQYNPMPTGDESNDLKFQANKVDGKAILNLNINKIKIVINGKSGIDGDGDGIPDGPTFMTNPTFNSAPGSTYPDIGEELPNQALQRTQAKIDTYGGTQMERDLSFPVFGAGGLQFEPALQVDLFKTGTNQAQVAKPKEVVDVVAKVNKVSDPDHSDIRETKVTFPDGVEVNSLADVTFCAGVDIDCGATGATDIGNVTVKTPALPEDLTGDVYLIDGLAPGDPYTMAVFLDKYANGTASPVKLKLFGEVKLNQDKRVVAEFKDLPPYPLTEFKMTVEGLMTTDGVSCEAQDLGVTGDFAAWNTMKHADWTKASIDAPADLDECSMNSNPQFDKENLKVESKKKRASLSTDSMVITISRDAVGARISSFNLQLPIGMMGDLAEGDKVDEATAKSEPCNSDAQIGKVTARAQVFSGEFIDAEGCILNGVPQGDELARIYSAIQMPEVGGGGVEVIPAKILIDDIKNGVPIEAGDIPREFNVTEMKMTIEGAATGANGYPRIVNPTQCSPGQFKVTLTSPEEGGLRTADLSKGYEATNCPPQPFDPQLDVTLLSGKWGKPVDLDLTYKQQMPLSGPYPQEAHVKDAEIVLPFRINSAKALKLNNPGIDFQELLMNNPGEAIGDVKAYSILLPDNKPIEGKVFLAGNAPLGILDGEPFEVHIPLKGKINTELEGTASLTDDFRIKTKIKASPQATVNELKFFFNDKAFELPPAPDCQALPELAIDGIFTPWTDEISPTNPTGTVNTSPIGGGCEDVTGFPGSKDVTVQSIEDKAGKSPKNLDINIENDSGNAGIEEILFKMPEGMMFNPQAAAQYSEAEVSGSATADDEKVGTITAIAKIGTDHEIEITGKVFMGKPDTGKPGKVYLALEMPKIVEMGNVGNLLVLEGDADLVDGNTRIQARIKDIPTAVPITSMDVTFFGQKGIEKPEPTPFIVNPTHGCGSEDAKNKFSVKLKGDDGSEWSKDIEYPVTNCAEQTPYDPKTSLSIEPPKANSPVKSTLEITQLPDSITLPDNEGKYDGYTQQPHSKKMTFTFDKRFYINSLYNAEICKTAHANAGKCGTESGSGTAIGKMTVFTPLAPYEEMKAGTPDGPLEGKVFLVSDDGQIDPDGPMQMSIFLKGLKDIRLNSTIQLAASENIVATMEGIPPVPLESAKLELNELLKTACTGAGTYNLASTHKAWAPEKGSVSKNTGVTVSQGCDPGASGIGAPKFTAHASNQSAGANPGKLDLIVEKDPAADPIDSMNVTLPHGMGASIGATFDRCQIYQASVGACPFTSRIGDVTATAQVLGPANAIQVTGGLFMAEPQGGEPARLVATLNLPAVAGGGTKVIQSPIAVANNANTITTDISIDMPQFNVTKMDIAIWGTSASGGQMLKNPSFASSGAFRGIFTSSLGSTAHADASYPVNGTLPFRPSFKASVSTTKAGATPVIETKIAQSLGHTATKDIGLSFTGFGIDIAKLASSSAICTAAQWSARACPDSSRVASLEASSWMIPGQPLTGAVFLGEGARKAYIMLRGITSIDIESDVKIDAKTGTTSLTIAGMPPLHADIKARVDGGLFKIPKEAKPLTIGFNATSYANQTSSESVCVANCVGIKGNKGIKFRAKLKPRRQKSSTNALFTVLHKDKKVSHPIKNLTIKLGKSKKSSLKFSRKRLKRLVKKRSSKRRGASFGRLTLTPTRKAASLKVFKFTLRAKRTGTLRISPNRKQLNKFKKRVRTYKRKLKRTKSKKKKKTYKKKLSQAKRNLKAYRSFQKHLQKKTRAKLKTGKLTVKRLPKQIKISGKTLKFRTIQIKLSGKRGGVLKNPRKARKITFRATSKPYKGKSVKAKSTVKLKKAKKSKRGKKGKRGKAGKPRRAA